jgi:glycosyltransferase 2 family protein
MMRRSGALIKSSGLVIGAVALYWVLTRVSLSQLGEALRLAHLGWIGFVVPLVVANMVLRAERWRRLFDRAQRPDPRNSCAALMLGYLANNVMFGRIGDLVRAYALGQLSAIPTSRVLGTIATERILDLAVATMMIAVVALIYSTSALLLWALAIVGASTLAGLAVLFAVARMGPRRRRVLVARLPFLRDNFRLRATEMMENFIDGLGGLGSPLMLAQFGIATAALWLTEIFIAWCSARAFALDLTMLASWYVLVFVMLASLVPGPPGQVGTFQFAAVAGLNLLGHSGPDAVAFALTWHAVVVMSSSLLGVGALVYSGTSLLAFKRAAVAPTPGERASN